MYENERQKAPASRTLSEPCRKKTQRLGIEDDRMAPSSDPAAGSAPLQLAPIKYIRGILGSGDKEIETKIQEDRTRLEQPKKVPAKGNRDDHLSDYLGGAILSVSRYREGLKNYYAPVGYVIELEPTEENVLGNYKGDGNISNPNMVILRNWLEKQGKINLFDNLSDESSEQDIKKLLRFYFQHNSSFLDPLGPGNPEALSAAEQDILNAENQVIKVPSSSREIKYTESEIHLNGLDAISGAYYNPNHTGKTAPELKKEAQKINTVLGKSPLFKINESGVLDKETPHAAGAPLPVPEETPSSDD